MLLQRLTVKGILGLVREEPSEQLGPVGRKWPAWEDLGVSAGEHSRPREQQPEFPG